MYLEWMPNLYRAIGEDAEWEKYIAALLAQYPRRPALQDELNRAGL